MLDLFVCLRPVQYFTGVPSPVKHPEKVNVVIFRENTEDIYAGIEWAAGSDGSKKVLGFIEKEFPKAFEKIRFGSYPFPEEIRTRINTLFDKDKARIEEICHLDFVVGELFAAAANRVIAEAGMTNDRVDLIATAGQTI